LTSDWGPRSGPEGELAQLVQRALAEDVGAGDATTLATVDPEALGRARVVARQSLVLAGVEAALAVFRACDPELLVTVPAGDGRRVLVGDDVLLISGRVAAILTGERTALNFLGRLSGIATLTRSFVDAVRGTGSRILDTRKTTPGWRALEKAAVRAGGGFNHRMGLYDFVLVKDNHVAAAGGVRAAVERVRASSAATLPLEVEVTSLAELEEALRLQVPRILLDNFPLEGLAEAVRRAHGLGAGRPELEASGNVTLENVRAIAETGVDWISVGALTHSAPAADLSLRVERP
jgi:nicotinate-nucleotide pyrophosphorylase (carboxylating)